MKQAHYKIRDGLGNLQEGHFYLDQSFVHPKVGSSGEFFHDGIDNIIFDIWNGQHNIIRVHILKLEK